MSKYFYSFYYHSQNIIAELKTRYADEVNLPRWVMLHPTMADIWREVNLNISITNDIFSLYKEIKQGDISSMLPILVYNRNYSIENAIHDACKDLQESINRFDIAAKKLQHIIDEKSPELQDQVEKYITGCRYNQTANLFWRYVYMFLPRLYKAI